jgi:hypothetical protein
MAEKGDLSSFFFFEAVAASASYVLVVVVSTLHGAALNGLQPLACSLTREHWGAENEDFSWGCRGGFGGLLVEGGGKSY